MPLQCFVGGFEEGIVTDGLQQIIQRIDFISFYRILAEGGGENDLRMLGQNAGKLDTTQFRHLDVQENQVNLTIADVFDGSHSAVIGTYKMQKRGSVDITRQQLGCQRFVVNYYAIEYHTV